MSVLPAALMKGDLVFGLGDLPGSVQLPLLLGLLVPLAGVICLAMVRRRPNALVARLSALALVGMGLGFAVMMTLAVVTTMRAGLVELSSHGAADLEQLGFDAERALRQPDPATALQPRLELLSVRDARLPWAAVLALPCTGDCVQAAASGLPRQARAALSARVRSAEATTRYLPWRGPDGLVLLDLRALRDSGGVPRAQLVTALAAERIAAHARALAWQLLVAGVTFALGGTLLARRLLVASVRNRVLAIAERLGRETGSAAAQTDGTDEIGALAARLEASLAASRARDEALAEARARTQRLEAVGRLAGGIAHDFNNLLTVISSNLRLLRDDPAPDLVAPMERAVSRGSGLVRQLGTFAQTEPLQEERLTFSTLFLDAVVAVRRDAAAEGWSVELPAALPAQVIRCDRQVLAECLVSLVRNAAEASLPGGRIAITVRDAVLETDDAERMDGTPGRYLVVAVDDEGMGLTVETAARAFEPFYSTKRGVQGAGLGLTMVYGAMRRLGGFASLEPRTLSGTRASLWFPLSAESAEAPPTVAAPPAEEIAGRQVLLVEDEDDVRRVTARMLTRLGYAVATSPDGEDALQQLEQGPLPDLVITDVMMPNVSGVELYRALRSRGLTLPVIFVTGYAEGALQPILDADPLSRLVPKPWTLEALSTALAEMQALRQRPDGARAPRRA